MTPFANIFGYHFFLGETVKLQIHVKDGQTLSAEDDKVIFTLNALFILSQITFPFYKVFVFRSSKS